MASHPVMELDIWKGEWGLPSIDFHCLEVMVRQTIIGKSLTKNPREITHSFFF